MHCKYCHNPDTRILHTGTLRTADSILGEIAEYRRFLIRARGGVTVSGGEPLVQPEFTEQILRGTKEMGLHTALDTAGYLGDRAPDSLLSETDLVLLDIKSILPDIYRNVTGVDIQPTLDFARRLSDLGTTMWVRFVLVPGLTDDPENVALLADFLLTLQTVQRVEILPFHKMGEHKWEALQMPYALSATNPPSAELVNQVFNVFQERSLPVVA